MLDSRTATSRDQAARIERDYYKRVAPLRSARRWLALAGVVAAAAWCGWGLADRAAHHSPGRVAAAHARWEQDCGACHVPLGTARSLLSFDAVRLPRLTPSELRSAEDTRCEACHRAAPHHARQIDAEVGSCGSCHADHQGREADITRVADRTCTACHGDIAAHRQASEDETPPPVTASITRFDTDHHPPFASLAKDPGRLKFSHGRHMTAGLTFGGPSKSPPLTYAMLGETDRLRAMPPTAAEGDLVQLSCGSCHEFATSLPTDDIRQVTARIAASKPGAYALPISFERHCAACHPLPFEPDDPKRSMPHGLDAEAMRRFILTAVLEASPSASTALDAPVPPKPLPANRPPPPPVATIRTELRSAVDASRSFARGMCGKCHDVADTELPVATLLEVSGSAGRGTGGVETWFRVPPVGVPDVWFEKARFDHGPHRGFDCRLCHAEAYPATTPGPSPLDNERVMIAGRESCTACHAPPGFDAAGGSVGGARFDCVECHGYHGLGPHQRASPHARAAGQTSAVDVARPGR